MVIDWLIFILPSSRHKEDLYDDSEDEEEEGIKITFRHEDIDLDSEDDDYDDVFIPSQGSRKQSGSIIYFMTKNDSQNPQALKPDLNSISDFTNELPFYQSHSHDDHPPVYPSYAASVTTLEEQIVPTIAANHQRERLLPSNIESFSSTTISSEDLTEYRDQNSSVFIIEQDTMQLSPSHPKKSPSFFSPSATTAAKRKISRESPSSKPSPIKVVTNLIFPTPQTNSPSTQSTGCK